MADEVPDDDGFVQEDDDVASDDEADPVEQQVASVLYPKFVEEQAKRQEELRASRPWSAPPLGSPRPTAIRAREEEKQMLAAMDPSELVVPREQYEPPERPYAAAITASGMAYMAPPRPMSADSYGRAGLSRLSVSGGPARVVLQGIAEEGIAEAGDSAARFSADGDSHDMDGTFSAPASPSLIHAASQPSASPEQAESPFQMDPALSNEEAFPENHSRRLDAESHASGHMHSVYGSSRAGTPQPEISRSSGKALAGRAFVAPLSCEPSQQLEASGLDGDEEVEDEEAAEPEAEPSPPAEEYSADPMEEDEGSEHVEDDDEPSEEGDPDHENEQAPAAAPSTAGMDLELPLINLKDGGDADEGAEHAEVGSRNAVSALSGASRPTSARLGALDSEPGDPDEYHAITGDEEGEEDDQAGSAPSAFHGRPSHLSIPGIDGGSGSAAQQGPKQGPITPGFLQAGGAGSHESATSSGSNAPGVTFADAQDNFGELMHPHDFAMQLLQHDISVLPAHRKAQARIMRPQSARTQPPSLAALGYLGYAALQGKNNGEVTNDFGSSVYTNKNAHSSSHSNARGGASAGRSCAHAGPRGSGGGSSGGGLRPASAPPMRLGGSNAAGSSHAAAEHYSGSGSGIGNGRGMAHQQPHAAGSGADDGYAEGPTEGSAMVSQAPLQVDMVSTSRALRTSSPGTAGDSSSSSSWAGPSAPRVARQQPTHAEVGNIPSVSEERSHSVLEEPVHSHSNKLRFNEWQSAWNNDASSSQRVSAGGSSAAEGSSVGGSQRSARPCTAPAGGMRRPTSARPHGSHAAGGSSYPAAASHTPPPPPRLARPMSAQPYHVRSAGAASGSNAQPWVAPKGVANVLDLSGAAVGVSVIQPTEMRKVHSTAAVDIAGMSVSVYVADTMKQVVEANKWSAALGSSRRYRLKSRLSSMEVEVFDDGPGIAGTDLLPGDSIKTLSSKQFIATHTRLKGQVTKAHHEARIAAHAQAQLMAATAAEMAAAVDAQDAGCTWVPASVSDHHHAGAGGDSSGVSGRPPSGKQARPKSAATSHPPRSHTHRPVSARPSSARAQRGGNAGVGMSYGNYAYSYGGEVHAAARHSGNAYEAAKGMAGQGIDELKERLMTAANFCANTTDYIAKLKPLPL